jgi:sulfur relay (sulfurtransferase) complex TusBCD TusD component (DsrE family)
MNFNANWEKAEMLNGKKLGILIISSPEKGDGELIYGIVKEAISQGIEVKVFLMGDGILYLKKKLTKEIVGLGAHVIFCAQNARERFISPNENLKGFIEEGSQYDLACIMEESDRFIAFS